MRHAGTNVDFRENTNETGGKGALEVGKPVQEEEFGLCVHTHHRVETAV